MFIEKAKVLSLEKALEWNRETVWLQMRWWKAPQPVRYALENSPWLLFRGTKEDAEIRVKAKEYGKSWRCFDRYPIDNGAAPWEDSGGRWTFEEDPED